MTLGACLTGLIATETVPPPEESFDAIVLDALAPSASLAFPGGAPDDWHEAVASGDFLDPRHHVAVCLWGMAAYETWVRRRERPAAFVGHSVGAYAAVVASGSIQPSDAIRLVLAAANGMKRSQSDVPLRLLALTGLESSRTDQILADLGLRDRIRLTHRNTPLQHVLSGTEDDLAALAGEAAKRGAIFTTFLDVPGVVHTPEMDRHFDEFIEVMESINPRPPEVDLYSCVSTGRLRTADEVRQYLLDQASRPVRFDQTIDTMAAAGVDEFVVLGSGTQLTKVLSWLRPGASVATLPGPVQESPS